MSTRLPLLMLLAAACTPEQAEPGVLAIVDPARAGHLLDAPFPSNDLLDGDGHADLSAYPHADPGPLSGVIDGWIAKASLATNGFSANGAFYFRFADAVEFPATTAGAAGDPVLLIDVATGERFPLEVAFVTNPADDPFYAPNTLAAAPALGHTPPSGATLVAVVMRSAGVSAPEGYTLPDGVAAALAKAGVDGEPAVATVYTVQDPIGELHALRRAIDAAMGTTPDWSSVTLKRVVRLSYTQGVTESGKDATVATTTYDDDTTSTAFLAKGLPENDHTLDLGESWPMAVYEAYLPVPYFQGLADRPFMRPGAGLLLDGDRTDGWLHFQDGELTNPAEADQVRVVISIPKDLAGAPIEDATVTLWDHGTGGSAYEHIGRKDPADDTRALNEVFAAASAAIVGRDQPMYGTRFPLVDSGFSDGSLGFYNIANLPAFRDNQRQGALEGYVVRRFVEEGLNDRLTEGSVDATGVRRFGHSLGSLTTHVGVATDPQAWGPVFVNGVSAQLVLTFLETGLANTGSSLFNTLQTLFQVEIQPGDSVGVVIAAALGVDDPDARRRFDRLHLATQPFTWILDPSDPTTVSEALTVRESIFMGIGDYQTPNRGTRALFDQLADATLTECTVRADYDPHYCLFREPEGPAAMAAWLAE